MEKVLTLFGLLMNLQPRPGAAFPEHTPLGSSPLICRGRWGGMKEL